MPEPWLSGPVAGIPALLQPAAHALIASREELGQLVPSLDDADIWTTTHGSASIGFHLLHLAGSTDRLLAYARGDELSAVQREVLVRERQAAAGGKAGGELLGNWAETVDRALAQLRATLPESLLEPRWIGRDRLPSNVLGVLFHAAEHAQRHTGQVVTTARILTARRPPP